jgi:hypothetical protein
MSVSKGSAPDLAQRVSAVYLPIPVISRDLHTLFPEEAALKEVFTLTQFGGARKCATEHGRMTHSAYLERVTSNDRLESARVWKGESVCEPK